MTKKEYDIFAKHYAAAQDTAALEALRNLGEALGIVDRGDLLPYSVKPLADQVADALAENGCRIIKVRQTKRKPTHSIDLLTPLGFEHTIEVPDNIAPSEVERCIKNRLAEIEVYDIGAKLQKEREKNEAPTPQALDGRREQRPDTNPEGRQDHYSTPLLP